jgi:hypothetical protein
MVLRSKKKTLNGKKNDDDVVSLSDGIAFIIGHLYQKGVHIMGKHFNPLEKEFLIRSYRSNARIKHIDF